MDPAVTARECREALESARNADGGWGYARGRGSRLEPTSLALVALAAAGARPGAGVLARWPREGALLADPQSKTVNISDNALAAVAAQALGLDDLAARTVGGLLGVKGDALPPSDSTRQDNMLQGWPWIADTFSWVEPTAWCLVALKRWSRTRPALDVAVRIEEGVRLLVDRTCIEGGWNYGNAFVLGHRLVPFTATTAIALLALQSDAAHPAVRRSLAYLSDQRLRERSGLALSLTLVALSLYGERTDDLAIALSAEWEQHAFMGNLMSTALALYALTGAPYDAVSH